MGPIFTLNLDRMIVEVVDDKGVKVLRLEL